MRGMGKETVPRSGGYGRCGGIGVVQERQPNFARNDKTWALLGDASVEQASRLMNPQELVHALAGCAALLLHRSHRLQVSFNQSWKTAFSGKSSKHLCNLCVFHRLHRSLRIFRGNIIFLAWLKHLCDLCEYHFAKSAGAAFAIDHEAPAATENAPVISVSAVCRKRICQTALVRRRRRCQ